MKKMLGMLLCIGLVVGLSGCGKNNPGDPTSVAAPTALTLAVAGADSLSLKLTWTASTDTATGYIVYLNDEVLDTVTACEYTHQPTELGDYEVKAYIGGTISDAAEKSSAIETATNEGPVYIVPSPLGPSGYGWASDGTGAEYSLGADGSRQNTDKVDFVLDVDSTLTSPSTFDTEFAHSTGIAYDISYSYDNLAQAPITGYATYEGLVDGATYVLWLQNKYYAKMQITTGTESGTLKITFKYGFQKIAGFRLLK
ncbi:MAG: hypothetical protein WC614_09940 [bacterium]